MWDSGASVNRSLFSRSHERHIFLFEKVIIFSKKIEAFEEKKSQEIRSRNLLRSVTTHLPNQLAMKMDGAEALYPVPIPMQLSG